MTTGPFRPTRRVVTTGLAALGAVAPFNIGRAQAKPLRIGTLLPKSGIQAFIGQSCQKGVELAQELLPQLGYEQKIEVMAADFESNPDIARSRAERLIADGADLLIGPFDSGAAMAISQVTEQKKIPFVVNIAAVPQLTEQGYKTVFRIFPTSVDIVKNGLSGMKTLFQTVGKTPQTAVFMCINDTYGQSNRAAIDKLAPTLDLPFKIVDTIMYDPAARDLSVEVAKARATNADILMLVSRLNDAILIVREMVKQRWEPQGIISPGSPGMYEEQFFKALGKNANFSIIVVPWYNPRSAPSRAISAAFPKMFPNDSLPGHIFNIGFTFEAMMVAADAARRAGSTQGEALIAALRQTDIENRVMIGGPIRFDEKGQNLNVASAVLQNTNLRPTVVLPRDVAEAAPVFPVPGWGQRG